MLNLKLISATSTPSDTEPTTTTQKLVFTAATAVATPIATAAVTKLATSIGSAIGTAVGKLAEIGM